MLVVLNTRRRWMLSVLEAVSDQTKTQAVPKAGFRHGSNRRRGLPDTALPAGRKPAPPSLADTTS
jgi:hypothetical protein